MNMNRIAEQYLSKEPLLNVDMLEAIRRELGEIVAASQSGVLLRIDTQPGEATYLLSADTPERGFELLELVEEEGDTDLVFTLHQGFLVEEVKKRFHCTGEQKCYQCVFTGEPRPIPEGLTIRPLEPCHAAEAAANYNDRLDFVKERIEKQELFGAFVEGRYAGMMGLHHEGSIGILAVSPEFRRQGIATALEHYMFSYCMDRGWVPYGHVIYGNEASRALQEKEGLAFVDSPVWWVYQE